MEGAVDERHLEVDDGVSRDDALGHGLDDAFFYGGAVLLRNDAADDPVHKFEPRAPGQRFDFQPGVAVLPPSAGLLLVLALDVRLALDGLLVRNLGGFQVDLNAELPPHLFHGDLDVDLSHPGYDHLLGLVVPVEMHGRVFFDKAVDGGDDLVFVAPALGFDGKGHDRGWRRHLFIGDRMLFVADGVAGARLLEFGKGGDVAGNHYFRGFLGLAFEEEDIAETFGELPGGVVHTRFRCQDAGIHPEEGKPAGIGIRNGLEYQCGEGGAFLGEAYLLFFPVWLLTLNRPAIHRRGKIKDDHIHQQARTDILQGGAAGYGNDRTAVHPGFEAAPQFLIGQFTGVEVFVHHSLVGFGDVFHHGFPPFLRLFLHIGGNIGGLEGPLQVVINQGLHCHQIDDSPKGIMCPDGQADRRHLDVHLFLNAGHGGMEIGPFPVHAVDEYHTGKLV